ncbi:MAG: hypothetical protein IIC78_02365 [Chloroflexi bacterium]|nr:hypothetical protein [Chloroflexota bacterium]
MRKKAKRGGIPDSCIGIDFGIIIPGQTTPAILRGQFFLQPSGSQCLRQTTNAGFTDSGCWLEPEFRRRVEQHNSLIVRIHSILQVYRE